MNTFLWFLLIKSNLETPIIILKIKTLWMWRFSPEESSLRHHHQSYKTGKKRWLSRTLGTQRYSFEAIYKQGCCSAPESGSQNLRMFWAAILVCWVQPRRRLMNTLVIVLRPKAQPSGKKGVPGSSSLVAVYKQTSCSGWQAVKYQNKWDKKMTPMNLDFFTQLSIYLIGGQLSADLFFVGVNNPG